MRIIFLPETLQYFNNLTTILFEKEYFGFKESALAYVDDLLNDIKDNLHLKVNKAAPSYFDQFGKGMKYATFKKNKSTHWYVFFVKYKTDNEIIYLIRHISNNHVIAQFL